MGQYQTLVAETGEDAGVASIFDVDANLSAAQSVFTASSRFILIARFASSLGSSSSGERIRFRLARNGVSGIVLPQCDW